MKFIAAFIFLALVSIFIVNTRSPQGGEQMAETQQTPPADVEIINPAIGVSSAPVTIEYYYDYQCKWCRDFEQNTLNKLKEYVESGDVRLVFKDFVFIGNESILAASAAECVFQQDGVDNFLQFHSELYERQQTKNTGWVTMELISEISNKLGLDTAAIGECTVSNEYVAQFSTDTGEGMELGITSTPSFLINGELVTGSQPMETFEKIISGSKSP